MWQIVLTALGSMFLALTLLGGLSDGPDPVMIVDDPDPVGECVENCSILDDGSPF